jgi:hypothetical protein
MVTTHPKWRNRINFGSIVVGSINSRRCLAKFKTACCGTEGTEIERRRRLANGNASYLESQLANFEGFHMATGTSNVGGEYEFSDQQNQLIGNLSRKMALVGFVAMLFGVFQMVNGVMSLFASPQPEKVLAAAKEAGMSETQQKKLEQALESHGWLSPWRVTAIIYAIMGLFLLMVGMWTQQSAAGFAGIVVTKGQDIHRLMDALGALYKKYSLIYSILLAAAIVTLISFGFTLYRLWSHSK